ncbi:MAPEG family protein [Sphingomonas sp. NIBR02145]|uniref:MAPEG family protein n=1 Tax=Sphingomonas sp. NIBR02145 TaxID=3014784 RepID=UPI0022B3BD19|nr:MAPEG family protein [Sphingomonas sp. NIBR02145]WHU05112.1 MAPEG family protein [Sphingomonas sp. NIBR02145]
MRLEMTVLVWSCLLALVHIFGAAQVKTRQYGTKWNMGARDEELPPPAPIVGRMSRAQANFFETFPLAIIAVVALSVTGTQTFWTQLGALLWLGGRIVYLPLYAAGVPVLRTIVFLVSLAGILMMLWPSLALGIGANTILG